MKNNSRKPDSNRKKLIEELKVFLRQNASKYLQDKNISSVGVGLKIKDGKRTDEICIQFTVDEKIKLEQLEYIDSVMIPKKIVVNGRAVPTDVLQRRYKLSFELIENSTDNNRKVRVDPIFPSVSICNTKGSAGTAGCIVYDKVDDTPYILSNWHVLHGDEGRIGDNIVQPGPHDDNRVGLNKSGTLVRSHLGQAGDCAIATIENRGYHEEIYELNANVRHLSEPELLDKVIKSGRTTGVTQGVVERVHVIIKIFYGPNTGHKEIGCFEIGLDPENLPSNRALIKGGDSGSVWLISKNNTATNVMAGLQFAGESSGRPHEHALACYPKSVFEKLGIRVSKSNDIQ